MEMDGKTIGMIIGIIIPAIVAVVNTFKARGSKTIIDTLVDSVEAVSGQIDSNEASYMKGVIRDMATKNNVGDRLYKIVKDRTSPSVAGKD